MKITIELEREPEPDRATNAELVGKMLAAQNLLEHERRVVAAEREWLDRILRIAGPEDSECAFPDAPEFASNWALAAAEKIAALTK